MQVDSKARLFCVSESHMAQMHSTHPTGGHLLRSASALAAIAAASARAAADAARPYSGAGPRPRRLPSSVTDTDTTTSNADAPTTVNAAANTATAAAATATAAVATAAPLTRKVKSAPNLDLDLDLDSGGGSCGGDNQSLRTQKGNSLCSTVKQKKRRLTSNPPYVIVFHNLSVSFHMQTRPPFGLTYRIVCGCDV